ncbi:MAG: CopG family transcriptional regulator [Deltaproteobacteria bacterium]|jgi:Arc/MetJ-type ribon-helix-helix transcriptional regulator|nr:CopG family transcriptional regulator [Deltaproteobacteria bacterium]MDL1989108.1 CopG family transcriptional regulator [Deltaproteobacteria bacterium]
MKTIQTEVPEQLYRKAQALVRDGWFRDEQNIFSEAIRRFLDTHRPELIEKFVREDVEWGLHGKD